MSPTSRRDDILILGDDKKVLLKIAFRIKDFVKENLALDFHKKGFQPFPVNRGIAFLGFRIYPFYRKVLPKGINRFRKRLKKLKRDYESGSITVGKVTQSIQSSLAFLNFGLRPYRSVLRISDSIESEIDPEGNTEKIKKELLRNYVLC